MNVRIVDKNATRRIYVHLRTSGTANLTSGSPTLTIVRQSDGYFWTGSAFQSGAATVNMSELDATNAPGIYYYDFAIPNEYDEYLMYVDGTASATYIRYYSEHWKASIAPETRAGHYQEQTIATGVVKVFDGDDDTTELHTLTPGKDSASNPTKSTWTPS